MIRKLAVLTLLSGVIALGAVPVYAHDTNEEHEHRGAVEDGRRAVTEASKPVTSEVEQTVDVDTNEESVAERAAEQRERIDAKKAELEAKLRQKQSERKEALEGRRLAMCENRQAKINSLLDKSAAKTQEQMLRIERFQEGVERFYDAKNLSSAEYDSAQLAVADAKANVTAALLVLNEDFDCTEIDGAKPSDTLKAAREEKHKDLKAYRDSVINLLQVVKAAFADKQAAAGDTTEAEVN